MGVCRSNRRAALWLAAVCLLAGVCRGADAAAPCVWILAGLAGDAARAERYLATVNRLRDAFRDRFHVPAGDVRVLFDRAARDYPACDAQALTAELDRIVEASKTGRALWVLFVGHAASGKGDARFHIAGPDVTARQIAERLSATGTDSVLVVLLTHTASGAFLPALAGRNRVLVAASAPGQEDNETEFPHALAEVLSEPRGADADGDGVLSVAEMVRAVSARVETWYRERGLMATERAAIDGNGDGRPDPAPNGEDDRAAAAVGLRYSR